MLNIACYCASANFFLVFKSLLYVNLNNQLLESDRCIISCISLLYRSDVENCLRIYHVSIYNKSISLLMFKMFHFKF